MPKKKTEDEVVETANGEGTEETPNPAEETAVEAQSAAQETPVAEASAETEETAVEAPAETGEETALEASAGTEEKPKKGGRKKAEATETTEETSIVDSVFDTVAGAVEAVAETVSSGVSTVVSAVTGDSSAEESKKTSKRAERIGIVSSDKMTKTVTVRVERQVKHPIYRKYIKRRKKFMAHDEMGATIGDKVRIIETRPLSAKKRWRVVEIIQKAEK
jgi:small subunit ribosomal protein S17